MAVRGLKSYSVPKIQCSDLTCRSSRMPKWEKIFLTLSEIWCPVGVAKYILKNKCYQFCALLEVFVEQGGEKMEEWSGKRPPREKFFLMLQCHFSPYLQDFCVEPSLALHPYHFHTEFKE